MLRAAGRFPTEAWRARAVITSALQMRKQTHREAKLFSRGSHRKSGWHRHLKGWGWGALAALVEGRGGKGPLTCISNVVQSLELAPCLQFPPRGAWEQGVR